MDKKLGKINVVQLGFGGYQGAMFGVYFDLGGKAWGVSDFWGFWARDPDKGTKWTDADKDKRFAEVMRQLQKLMEEANVRDLDQLKGKPVEVIFKDQTLKSWRILTEVV